MKYSKIIENELQFRSLTCLSSSEFESLSSDFRVEFEEFISKYIFEGKERLRRYQPRKTSSLTMIEDKLFLTLVFMKINPQQEYHAACFGITQPKSNMFIPPLRKILSRLGELLKGNPYQLEQLLKNYDDILLDGTERAIQRPLDYQTIDEHYSVKKTHNMKNNIISPLNLRILWVSHTYKGKIHDKHI